jgi:hypothetical protein
VQIANRGDDLDTGLLSQVPFSAKSSRIASTLRLHPNLHFSFFNFQFAMQLG